MFKFLVLAAFVAVASASTNFLPRTDGRIVGGDPVEIEKHPYQLALFHYGNYICGGSIISTKFAVTAAHCTAGSTATSLTVRAGSSMRTSGGVVIRVKKIHQNPNHSSHNFDYDISVLEFSSDLTFDDRIQKIDLPTKGESTATGAEAVCTGWGAAWESGSLTSKLQAVTVNIVSQAKCQSAYASYAITDRMICAGVENGGKDACQGDSGGPLVVDGKLVGIVSWGYGCARPTYPGVYSNVANLRDYITETAGI